MEVAGKSGMSVELACLEKRTLRYLFNGMNASPLLAFIGITS